MCKMLNFGKIFKLLKLFRHLVLGELNILCRISLFRLLIQNPGVTAMLLRKNYAFLKRPTNLKRTVK